MNWLRRLRTRLRLRERIRQRHEHDHRFALSEFGRIGGARKKDMYVSLEWQGRNR